MDRIYQRHIPVVCTAGVTDVEGVTEMVVQVVLLSSSPPGQSVAPSHTLLAEMHVPSLQANCSVLQVTVTHKGTQQSSFNHADGQCLYYAFFLPLLGQMASSVPAGQSLCPSHTLLAGTHLSSGHWSSPGAHTHLKQNK